MKLSWLPSDAPPTFDPALVAVLAFVAIVVIVVLALFAYARLWGERGWVERMVAFHRAASHTEAGDASGDIFHSREGGRDGLAIYVKSVVTEHRYVAVV